MRTRLATAIVGALVTGFVMPHPGTAFPVIDSFETGSFTVAFSPPDAQGMATVGVSSPAHALTPLRQVTASSGGKSIVSAVVEAFTASDDFLNFRAGPDGGELLLQYLSPAPIDLTAGGVNDRVVARVAISPEESATVELSVWDDLGGFAASVQAVSSGETVHGFAQLGGVDLSRVTRLDLSYQNTESAEYWIYDIRATRDLATRLAFEVPTKTVVGPPFPIPPAVFEVLDEMPSDLQSVSFLSAMDLATGDESAIAITPVDSGEDVEAGLVGQVSCSWNAAGIPYESTAFELQVDVAPVSGIDPTPFLPELPTVVPTSTGFMVLFDVHFLSDAGQVERTSQRLLAVDAFAGQPIGFEAVQVLPPVPLRGQATSGFRVALEAVDEGLDVDEGEPLFEVSFTGDSRLEAVVSAPPPAQATRVAQALEAFPGVTRAGTALRLTRPAGADGRIDLFDAAGRRLRTLDVRRGDTAIFWDGRDVRGEAVPAGVTFARFIDGEQMLEARIVHVR